MGKSGEFDVFVTMKSLMHQVGFHSWAGAEAASPKYLNRMIANFEKIDPETGFQVYLTFFLLLLLFI